MPPTRRTTSTPPPKGRRPKIAGQQASARARSADAPPADRTVEPSGGEPPVVQAPAPPTPADSPAVAAAAPARGSGPADEPAVEVETTPAGTEPPAAAAPPAPPAPPAEVAESEAPAAGEAAGVTDLVAEVASPVRPVNRTSALRPRQRSGSAITAEEAGDQAPERGWLLVVAIGVVALVLAVVSVFAAFRPWVRVPNRAWVDTSTTTQVAAAARNAIQTLYTYKFDTVDQDFDNARAVLTDDMRTQFDQTAQVTRDAVIQTKTATEAQVTDIGVKLLDGDRAELVASMNVSASNDGVAQGSAAGPLSVTMSKVGDTWLLSDIRDR